MAKQRQTDVNINYHVNTVEVDKADQLLKKVSQTTDQARAATNNFGQQAGKSFQATSKYIEGMEIELARLRQQIKLTSTQDTARLTLLSNQYKALKAQIDSYNKSLFEQSKATKQAATDTRAMATQFGEVYTAAKLFITAGIAKEVVTMSLEMAKLSGNVEGVERAFNRIPGAEAIIVSLREATHGAVTDLELMQRALKAQNFGLSLSALPPLLEFAAVRAQQTGVAVDYMVNSIVDGIGRKSLRVLDNLQISQSRIKEEMHGISLEAASVAQVSEAMGRIASEELRKMGGFAETSATQVDQLTTSWHELKVEASEFFTEGPGGGIISLFKDYVDSFRALIESYNRGIPVAEVFAERQRQIVAEMSVSEFTQRRFTKDKVENIRVVEEEIAALTKSIGSWAAFRDEMQKLNTEGEKEISRLRQSVNANQDEIIEIAQGIKLRKDLINAKKEDTLIDQEILKLLQARLLALRAVSKEEKTTEDGGKRSAPEALKQTIDFDLKNPVTGEVTKYDRDNVIKAFNDMALLNAQVFSSVTAATQTKFEIKVSPPTIKMDAWDKIGEEFAARWKEIVSAGIQDTADIVNSFLDKEADSYDAQLSKLQAFYDEQTKLAGDNERYKSMLAIKRDREEQALRKKAFESDKEAKRLQTIVNGAAGIINAFATLPYPAAIVASVLLAGTTAAQLQIINNQQYKGFAKGVIDLNGPGNKTSDSIPARLSKGESVMTADETSSSMGILKAVRAKKLNDRMMRDILSGRSGGSSAAQVFNDANILKKLDEVKNATPDLVQRGNLIYEQRKKSDTYWQWVRSKSMNP